ncbi:MAG TPA: endolytic transglycosylase MltG [Candidatus Moranbacteria bacterium]|nr:endolytic transglycosylase MltG [Candidatus Moranbacteria bacterium]
MRKKFLSGFLFFLIALCAAFFYFRAQIYFSQGDKKQNVLFKIEKGESKDEIGENLSKKGIIKNKLYFLAYFAIKRETKSIYPGEYLINGNMTIPELATVITNPKKIYEKVLFKEGWTAKIMAEELESHGFSGKDFLDVVNNPSKETISQFKVLKDKPQDASLEGYLFPDTYYFSKEATAEGIIKKILNNTEEKMDDSLISDIEKNRKTIFETIVLASIVEKEMARASEAKLIAGVFQNRLDNDMLLQSDAPLTYILGDKEDQHSLKDLDLDSPYNTYKNKGLPPGPISNPGMDAILAAINPEKSDYHFFLTAKEEGKLTTIFSKTFEEHVANRKKYGL